MRLAAVISDADPAYGELEIRGLAYATAGVEPGTLFFCVPGFTRDGHEFAGEAVERGAVALVVERPLSTGVPEIRVDSVRRAMAPAAARFYRDPTRALTVVGVTGTNGKTTTAFLVRAMLEGAGVQTGLLGTVKSVVGGVQREVVRTTPEAIDLQCTFREMVDAGDRACVMEVSSHALELHRADCIHFAASIFTNLTQDHLDFHGTMEEYFAAKRRLFVGSGPTRSVVNVDDAYGRRLAAELSDPITFAIDNPDASYRASGIETSISGSRFTIAGPEGETPVSSPLTGRFNVYNVLGAFAAVRAIGVSAESLLEAIKHGGQVPGRFETVDEGQPFAVIVDYAHTPDSLENVLSAARPLTHNRLHVVFGAGGDRDRGKRPMMGEIAAGLADRVTVTSDNPRSEDPDAIIAEILAGIPAGGPVVTSDPDRKRAIERAITSAEPGDVVVIAGKGHEQGQEFAGGHKLPFDDVTVARDILRACQ